MFALIYGSLAISNQYMICYDICINYLTVTRDLDMGKVNILHREYIRIGCGNINEFQKHLAEMLNRMIS